MRPRPREQRDGRHNRLSPPAQKSWRRLDGHNQLPKIIEGVKFIDGLEVVAKPADPQAQTTAA
jgi:putative transposase